MKKVILDLGQGKLTQGFSDIRVEIYDNNQKPIIVERGSLPTNQEIKKIYEIWKEKYNQQNNLRIQFNQQPTSSSRYEEDFENICRDLLDELNSWLNSPSFLPINYVLRTRLQEEDDIEFILKTTDKQVRQLPWHLWYFFDDYPKAEVIISSTSAKRVKLKNFYRKKIRILAIFGHAQGIDLQEDKDLLNQLNNLPNIELVPLYEPTHKQLNETLWDKQGWDILCYSGHSSSEWDGSRGWLEIQPNTRLELAQFKNALKRIIQEGLKLAILNSCDGLGLAKQLEDLGLPFILVMREPISNHVAQQFLKEFINKFFLTQKPRSKNFYLAVKEARERLENYPCATWLPVICKNTLQEESLEDIFLKQLQEETREAILFKTNKIDPISKQLLAKFSLISFAITTLIMGGRWLGLFQFYELQAYDNFLQIREDKVSDKGRDNRLLIITIDREDYQYQDDKGMDRRGGSLSDEALKQLLEILEKAEARTIGLDIYRDFKSNDLLLSQKLQQMNNFIAICRADDLTSPKPLAIYPPPEVPSQRLGFADVIPDKPDEVVRRHLLGMDEGETCPTELSLSFKLILHYLKQENIEPKITSKNQIKIGNVILPRLQKPAGGYSYLKFDDEGYQILLNYRTDKPIAVQYPLRDILDKRVNPNLIKDRIVLIGNTDYASRKDDFSTPFTQNSNQKMRGVMIHAQMVSQVLSAVLDGRPLLWVLPVWGDIVWVWVWVIIGGIIGWVGRYLERLQGIGVMAISVVILGISCFVIFIQLGGWFPLIPAVLGLLVTGIVMRVTNKKI